MRSKQATRFTSLLSELAIAFFIFSCSDSDVKPQPTAEAGEELSGGENLTAYDYSENAFGHEAKGLASDQFTDFVVGNSLFRTNWVTAPASVKSLDGLGPMMNAISCGSCHFKDGRGKPADAGTTIQNGLLVRLSIAGQGPHGEPLDDPMYGGQLQDKSILGVTAEGSVQISYEEITGEYSDGTSYTLRKPTYNLTYNYGAATAGLMTSPRVAQQIPGMGLLENVSDETILSFADENDANGDGISGRPNYVWDRKTSTTVLGRFGWKANQPSLLQQAAGAFNGDIGITTSLFQTDCLTQPERDQYSGVPDGGDPELSDEQLNKIVLYLQTLSVPARRDVSDQTVLKGKQIFVDLHCSACHIQKMTTKNDHVIASLNGQTIRPYTDLLLHDMGEDLADNRPDFLATGTEWRTAPLWGIGMVETVNRHTTLLHDGRARNAEEAILWHGGEAAASRDGFKNLSASDREALIKFLQSL